MVKIIKVYDKNAYRVPNYGKKGESLYSDRNFPL